MDHKNRTMNNDHKNHLVKKAILRILNRYPVASRSLLNVSCRTYSPDWALVLTYLIKNGEVVETVAIDGGRARLEYSLPTNPSEATNNVA